MVDKVYSWSEKIFYLMKVNFFWMLFSLFGGIILGVVPATMVTYSCIRKLIREKEEVKLWEYYKQNFFGSFKKSLLYSFFFVGLAFLFSIEQIYLKDFFLDHVFLQISYKFTLFIFILFSLFFFPVNAHYDLHGSKVFLQPFLFLFICPIQAILTLVIAVLMASLYYINPVFFPFIGISVPAFWISHVLLKKFDDLQTKIIQSK